MKKFILANWKMNLTLHDMDKFLNDFEHWRQSHSQWKPMHPVILFPPQYLLGAMVEKISRYSDLHSFVQIGAQNFYTYDMGAFTGETSLSALEKEHISYVLIGHSERRVLLSESDSQIAKKMHHALSSSCLPVLCIGEPLEIREKKQHMTFLQQQLENCLFANEELLKTKPFILAYEPIWSIGTGIIPSVEELKEVFSFLHEFMQKHQWLCQGILYGGSVNSSNMESLNSLSQIDGFLIGSASNTFASFQTFL